MSLFDVWFGEQKFICWLRFHNFKFFDGKERRHTDKDAIVCRHCGEFFQ